MQRGETARPAVCGVLLPDQNGRFQGDLELVDLARGSLRTIRIPLPIALNARRTNSQCVGARPAASTTAGKDADPSRGRGATHRPPVP